MTGKRRVAVAAVAVAALTASCSSQPGQMRPQLSPPSTSSSSSLPTGTPVAVTSPPVTAPPVDERAVARQALAKIVRRLPPGAVSLAVRDADTGEEFDFGAHRGMWTASVYKLLVLEALLLERQDSGYWF